MSNKQVHRFRRYVESTGRDIAAYVSPNPDVSGVIRLRDRDQKPTLPPPADLAADLRRNANRIRKMAAAMLAEANDLDRAAERIES